MIFNCRFSLLRLVQPLQNLLLLKTFSLKGCTESYRRANSSRKERGKCGSPRSPLAFLKNNLETYATPQKACYELPTCATYFSLPSSFCDSWKPEDYSISYRRTIRFCAAVIRWLVLDSWDRRSWSAARLSCQAWAVSLEETGRLLRTAGSAWLSQCTDSDSFASNSASRAKAAPKAD